MTVPIARSGGRPLVERRQLDASGQYVTVREKRRRADDLRDLLVWACEHAGVLPLINEPTDQPRGYEVGLVISLRDAGRAIGLDPELVQSASKRKHFSPDQLAYIEGLVLDLPAALTEAMARLRRGVEEDRKS
jgi:hypothetical protein